MEDRFPESGNSFPDATDRPEAARTSSGDAVLPPGRSAAFEDTPGARDPVGTSSASTPAQPMAGTHQGPDSETGYEYGGGLQTADRHRTGGMDTAAGTQHPGAMRASGDTLVAGGTPRAGSPAGAHAATADVPLLADAAQIQRSWQEIQAAFVDDPHESVQRAADLAEQVVNTLVTTMQDRTRDLHGAWHDGGADTERLRTVLRSYRMFIDRLRHV